MFRRLQEAPIFFESKAKRRCIELVKSYFP
jgi:hypothetical protein